MIPEGWELRQLYDLSSKISDGLHSTPNYVESSDYFFINGNNLKNSHIVIGKTTKCVSKEEAKKHKKELTDRTILMSINGTIGNLAYYQGENVILGKSAAYINLKESVNKDFIYYFLSTSKTQQLFESELTGTTIRNLSLRSIKSIKILLPPLPEQKKIAQILSTWDKGIATVEKLIENSQQKKKALMQQLLTGKKRFPEFDGEWKEIRLGDVLNGKKRKGKIVPTNENQSGMAYIGSTSFDGNFGIYTDSANAVTCSPNDILVLWDGENAGKVTTGLKGAVSSTVVRYCINQTKADSLFLTYNLLKDNYKVRAIREGSGIPHMPGDFEQWYRIALPPLEEQQKIASALYSTDQEIETWQQELEHLKQEKKALMQQLLTGKRRVKLSKQENHHANLL